MDRVVAKMSLLFFATTCVGSASAGTVSWTDSTGFWDVASNWDIGVPNGSDDANINVSGTHTITLRANGGPFIINGISMTGDETLSLAGGNITVNNSSTIANFAHSTGILSGAGNIVISGAASLALSNLTSVMTGPGITTLKGTTAIGGYAIDNGRVLRNEGTATLTGGIQLNRVNDGGSGRIDNAAGALFDIKTFNTFISATAHSDINTRPGFPAFNNDGTLRRSSVGTYGIAVAVRNSGLIELTTGNLNLSGGGTHSGDANLATGTTLALGGGTHEILAGATFAGEGTLQVSGNAMVDFKVPTLIASRFNHNTGILGGADLTLSGPTTLALSNLTSVMTGPGTTTLKGLTSIVGYAIDNGRILRNEGTATLTGGVDLNRINDGGAGRIDNAEGALFDIKTFNTSIFATAHADLGSRPGFPAFNNAGTLRRSSAGTYTIGVPLTNTGSIELVTGNLTLSGGSTNSGANELADGTTLGLAAGVHAVDNGATFAGLGTVALAGAGTVLQLNAPTTLESNFSMTGGTIRGGDLTFLGDAAISISSSLGVMSGSGTTTLKSTSLWSGGPNNAFGLDGGRVLRNEGSARITGVINLNRLNTPGEGSGRIDNLSSGVIDIQTFNQSMFATNWSDLDNGLDAVFDNAGLLKKTSRGNYTISVHFNNTGTVAVENGSLTFASASGNLGIFSVSNNGHLIVSAGSFINQGTLQGNGTFDPPSGTSLINSGLLAAGFSVGALTIAGDYEQTATGVYEVELGSLASFDTLDVQGNLKLDGTLHIVSLDGYSPTIGDAFTIASFDDGIADASDLTGLFANVIWEGFAPGIAFTTSYFDHSIVLNTVANPVPLPVALWLFAPALGVLGFMRRSGQNCGR